MVVIFLPTASLTEVWQDRTASPLTWTVQAPHRPAPQPNFVPVICNCSRMTQSSGVSLAASTDIFRPLIFKVGMVPPKGGVQLTRPSAHPAMSLHLLVEIFIATNTRFSCPAAGSPLSIYQAIKSKNQLQGFAWQCRRIFRSRRFHEMMQPVLQVSEFVQGHVQKAIKLAQHLLGPLPKRNPLRRQSDNHATFVARRPLPRDESLALNT